MIFSKFFRPKWQHSDANIRLEAIRTLEASDNEQKTHLHELAFNDPDTSVRLAALNKLDNFSIWWKLSQTDKTERVRKFSLQKVEKQVLALEPENISVGERETFLKECTNKALLEKVVNQLYDDLDAKLLHSILVKLDKPQVTQRLFFKTQSIELQRELLPYFDDENNLAKVIKRVEHDEIIALAQKALDEIKYAKSRPIQLEKELRLILSKLLALKDVNDFDMLKASREQLSLSYDQLKADFQYLATALLQEVEDKYRDINRRLDKQMDDLSVVWKEQQAAIELTQKFEEAFIKAKTKLQEVGAVIAEQSSTLTSDSIEGLKEQLKSAADSLQNTLKALGGVPDPKQRKKSEDLFNQLSSTELTLSKLPDFQEAIKKGKDVVDELRKATLPESYEQLESAKDVFEKARSGWRAFQSPYKASWPADLKQEWKTLEKTWQSKLKQTADEAEQSIKQTRSMFKRTQNLVRDGKYHGAMRLFEKAKVSFEDLPEKPKSMLERLYSEATDQIENLKGWQSYLAQPRKPALIEEAQAIVDKPLAISEQADKVKLLRKQWISLGVSDDEQDQALNQQFDALCEKAFEPCREHFAEQEKQRQENFVAKQALLESFEGLSESLSDGISLSDVSKQLRALQNKWQTIGEIDYQYRDEVNQRYRKVYTPLKESVNAYYKDNAAQKTDLVARAEKLADMEDLQEATEQSKQLQEKWKAIGHAGFKQEKTLWSKFRAFNNQVFAKKEAIYLQQREDEKALVDTLESRLNALNDVIDNSTNKAELISQVDDESQSLRLDMEPLHPKAVTRLTTKLDKLLNKQQQKLDNWEQVNVKQRFNILFEAVSLWTETEKPQALAELPSAWQQCFDDLEPNPEDDERLRLTLMLEIIGNIDSPLDDAGLRKAVQLEMMAAKLEEGESQDKETLLKDWIKLGPLSANEQVLLPRVKAAFV
jgi:hypothetical protein